MPVPLKPFETQGKKRRETHRIFQGSPDRHGCGPQHVDGVICGHTHHAEIEEINGILYCNDGDWVESCTALAESLDGSLHLLKWTNTRVPSTPPDDLNTGISKRAA